MSGNGAVWGRVRGRLRAFPERLAACGAEVRSCRAGQCLRDRKGPRGRGGDRWGGAGAGSAPGDRRARGPLRSSPVSPRPQAAAYGRCVQASTAPGGRLTKDLCAQEFEALRSCFAAAVGGRRPGPLPCQSARGGTAGPVLGRRPAFPCRAFGAGRLLLLPTRGSSRRGARVPACVRGGELQPQREDAGGGGGRAEAPVTPWGAVAVVSRRTPGA